jgi:galactokinase
VVDQAPHTEPRRKIASRAEVEAWQVSEVVHLLGEQLGHCGAPSLAIATGRTLIVKARPRDDDSVNVWVDGRRSSMPPGVEETLDDHGLGSAGADVVIETEPSESAAPDDRPVLMTVETGVAEPADRRDECRQATKALGLIHLAEAGPDAVLKLDDESLKARTRHVITETARVRAAGRAVESEAWAQLGAILTASHASLRDDFEVSCAELDVVAEAAIEAGALGARLNVALVPADRVQAVRELVELRFDGVGWRRPEVRTLGVANRA